MNIKDTHDWLDFMLEKTRSGFFPPEEKDAALNRAQQSVYASYFSSMMGSQFVHQALQPFRKETSNVTNSEGVMVYPTDYQYAVGTMITTFDNLHGRKTVTVRIYKEDEVAQALTSQIRPVNEQNPIGLLRPEGLLLLPRKANYTVTMYYLARPIDCKYAYTVSGRDIIFSLGSSVNLQWGEPYVNEVMIKALELLGVNLNSPDIVQYANEKINMAQTTPIKN